MLVGFVTFIAGLVESETPQPVSVGEQFISKDPFKQHVPVTVIETNGEWVKWRTPTQNDGSFYSEKLTTFRAWYPNKYVKAD